MRLIRQAGQNNTQRSTPLFDKKPAIYWNAKTKEITLIVERVPHESPKNTTRYEYLLSLSIRELQDIIGKLAEGGA